jgi:hypothetical protein
MSPVGEWLDPEISAPSPDLDEDVRATGVLLITRTSLNRQYQTLIDNLSPRLVHVVVRGTEDEKRLAGRQLDALPCTNATSATTSGSSTTRLTNNTWIGIWG